MDFNEISKTALTSRQPHLLLQCVFSVTSLWRQSLFTLWLRCFRNGF